MEAPDDFSDEEPEVFSPAVEEPDPLESPWPEPAFFEPDVSDPDLSDPDLSEDPLSADEDPFVDARESLR